MMKEGIQATEKDKACFQANLIRNMEASEKEVRDELEKQEAEEKEHPL